MLSYKLSMVMSYVLIAVSLYSRVYSFPRAALKTVPQNGGLKRSEIFFLPQFWKLEALNQGVGRGDFFQASEGDSVPCFFSAENS